MTTFTFPNITPASNTFELVSNTRTYQSPLTNAIQTASRKGSLWKASLQFKNLDGDDRQEMQAFLVKLNGQQHRFTLHDHSFTRRGAGGGTLLVNGSGQSGTSLVCNGASASITSYLRAGDQISFANELHMVVSDANSDASGNVTLTIAPPIRKVPSSGTVVDYATPVSGVFMLSGPASWNTRVGVFSDFSIEAVEDVLA